MSDRYLPADWPLPKVQPFNRAFFTAGALTVQRCEACGMVQHPPMDVCHRCQSLSFAYEAAAGSGTIANFTIVHHASDARLKPLVPYNVALVRLTDHPDVLVVGNVIDVAPDEIHVGADVRCSFATVVDGQTGEEIGLPQWELVR